MFTVLTLLVMRAYFNLHCVSPVTYMLFIDYEIITHSIFNLCLLLSTYSYFVGHLQEANKYKVEYYKIDRLKSKIFKSKECSLDYILSLPIGKDIFARNIETVNLIDV